MGEELVNPYTASSPPALEQIFEREFPYYLSIGMTYDQYWEKDCQLVKAYRKAAELRKSQMNAEAHLQGMYFYEALCNVSPLLQAFAKQGTTALPYPAQPYALSAKEVQDRQIAKLKEDAKKFAMFVKQKNRERSGLQQ